MTTARTARSALRTRFRELHGTGMFVMPNPWDVGSAAMLAGLGFPALATTSSGHAATLGRADQQVTRDELLAHVAALVAAVDVPISVDAEGGFAGDPAGVGQTYRLIGETGAAGASIEDYDPGTGRILDPSAATERVGAAAEAAHAVGMVLTARAEQHLYQRDADLEDTIARLTAYRDAGADVVYAPGLRSLADIERLVQAVDAPVNVLRMPGTPPLPDLAGVGVRRISTGGALARTAYAAATDAARALLDGAP
jgi:2-methylisocitrate lyase-like PEP mutase family enzyme